MRASLIALFCLVTLALPGADSSKASIFAGKLLMPESGKYLENVTITIEGESITAIEADTKLVSSEEVIDLSGYTVLPGLIDVHTHLCDNTYLGEEWDLWTYPAAMLGVVGTVNARKTLEAGFTTVRNVSEPYYADVALRNAINSGMIPGPRIYASGPIITSTGGHGHWGNWMAPQNSFDVPADAEADGHDEVLKETRKHIRHGVDLIKIAVTGGFGSSGTVPAAATYSEEEIRTAVDEAHRQGLKVAAHAHGTQGINNAIRAGVDSIEHGSLLDLESIELMKENQTHLVMDLLAAHYDLVEKSKDYSDKALGHSNEDEYKQYSEKFRLAYDQGVKMAFGSDAGVYPHGRNAEQFKMMVDSGMSALDAIRSATIDAAELIGIANKTGRIEVGYLADFIAVEGDPLRDISVLEDVSFVMRAGITYKEGGNWSHH